MGEAVGEQLHLLPFCLNAVLSFWAFKIIGITGI